MTYKEIHGDLFSVDDSYYLCHCISSDFALGKGIAVQFDKRYNMRNKLNLLGKNNPKPRAILIDNVFNLVTKEKYWQKPTYSSLRLALEDMRNQVNVLRIYKIAMPCIGSGLDRLEWSKVSKMIKEIFMDSPVDIVVYIK